jgi:hypothetical protein
MTPHREPEWTIIYETRSASDAELVRMTLEVAGYRVSSQTASSRDIFRPGPGITVAVPVDDAEDARDFLKQKTSLLSQDLESAPSHGKTPTPAESLADAAQDILELRRQHQTAACKYCGIPTLDVGESELDSRMIALLRAAGLGVNSATFSEFQPGERICTDCAAHEVSCEICDRVLDAYVDGGEYRQTNDDEGYICSDCMGRLEDQLQAARDW